MAGVSLECTLMLGYAVSLALIALLRAANHAHRRSLELSTAGFTYHPDQDVWSARKTSICFRFFRIPSGKQ